MERILMNKPASYRSVLNQFKSMVKEAGVASNPSACIP